MRIACLLVLGVGLAAAGTYSGQAPHGAATSPTVAAAHAAADTKRSDFARMPDGGTLLAYDMADVRRQGAYTYYRTRISEDHALKAIGGGEIRLRLPSGEIVRLAYRSHVEHPDGNWTWVGHVVGDSAHDDVILTFGSKAIFGSLPDGAGGSLRLTTTSNGLWLVASDASRLPATQDSATRKPDFLLPPRRIRHPGQSRDMASANAAATNQVDLVLGYSSGLASALGGASQAITRLNFLVDVTNQAYVNSNIPAQLVLVGTVQVNYADATDNGDALQKLTGSNGSSAIPVDAAFQGLRDAREQFHADLVGFVRKFQTPQNASCGIAWLIGGGGEPFSAADADFGYAVVSDGNDIDETDGKTYFCRDETLAHEAGHNMGQAHNSEDSSSTGAHPYSYGYREASVSGFYSVMAYRLASSSQTAIRYFANPSIAYQGRPTGVANQADNVRSMVQTLSIVSAFRAGTVAVTRAVRNDMDGNGKSDFLWWNQSIGTLAYWSMDGPQFVSGYNQDFGTSLSPWSTGHSNGPGRTDILMRRLSDRSLLSFQSQPSGLIPYTIGQYGNGWVIAGQGDIDGDGKEDIVWREPTLGYVAFWLMSGSNIRSTQTFSQPPDQVLGAIADLSGDGRADLVWVSNVTRVVSTWISSGSGFSITQVGGSGTDWRLVGALDVTGDGKADLLWRNTANTYVAYWRMDGASYLGSGAQSTPADFVLSATGDYNGDGVGDLAWTRPADRSLFMWIGNGVNFGSYLIGQYGADWALQP